jgi:hypothetical protein
MSVIPRLRAVVAGGAGALLAASVPAAAQLQVSAHVSTPDSVAWVVAREPLGIAEATLRNRDRTVAVLLNDTTIVLQLTDRGLDRISHEIENDSTKGIGSRFLARLLGAGVVGLLDHGIAHHLSALRAARVEGTRLVLENRDGARVFADVDVNGRRVMDDFSPAEAERFATAVNDAIRRARR